MRPVAWWRSTTAIFARSRAGSATTSPSAHRGLLLARERDELARDDLDHAHARRLGRDREGVGGQRRRAHRAAHAVGDRRARRTARPRRRAATSRPSLHTRAGRNDVRSSSSTRSARRPGRDRAAVQQPVARAGCSVAISSASSGAIPSSTAIRHIWSMCPSRNSRSGSRSSVQNAQCSGPYSRHQRQQVAQVARVRGLADQHPHPAAALLQRLLERRRLVVGADAGRDVGVQRAAGDARGVAVDVARRRSARARRDRRR